MVNELKDEDILEEGYTEFGGGSAGRWSSYFSPTGRLGRWFSKFFATKAQPYVAQQEKPGATPQHPLGGDTVVNRDVVKPESGGMGFGHMRSSPHFPAVEVSRKHRNKEYEQMDEYPEIGAAFDIYADDCTQRNIRNDRWSIISDSSLVVEEIEKLFQTIKLDRLYWDITRNTVKYGDCFIETIVDVNNSKEGIQRLKVLNPNYIVRVENEYGYLTDFLQEIPNKNAWDAFGQNAYGMEKSKYISLDKNQLIHFRLHTSDPMFYPYGRSIAALAHRIFRSLRLMEDAMLVYRIERAPERRIFYVDVGNLPSTKAEMFVEKLKQKFKKEKFYSTNGKIDERFNPLSINEDFFVPMRGTQGTKIETLPGAQNLGETEDVKYFRDKLLAALKIPKDYIVEKDKSPERKANLSQLDVKFARTISRIQHSIEVGLETLAKRHLVLKGFPLSFIRDLRIELPDPSDMYTKRKLDVDQIKASVVSTVISTGLFPKRQIYKEYYNLNDSEIDEIEKALEEEGQAAGGAMGGGGSFAPGGASPPPEGAGMESAENTPPTSEELLSTLNKVKNKIALLEGKTSKRFIAMKRIIDRENTDNEN